jgi:hypothetical protein
MLSALLIILSPVPAGETFKGAGKKGSSTARSASVKSLGKVRSARAYCARVMSVHIVDFLGSLQNLMISDLDWRQANPLTPLNLISDQALGETQIKLSLKALRDLGIIVRP